MGCGPDGVGSAESADLHQPMQGLIEQWGGLLESAQTKVTEAWDLLRKEDRVMYVTRGRHGDVTVMRTRLYEAQVRLNDTFQNASLPSLVDLVSGMPDSSLHPLMEAIET